MEVKLASNFCDIANRTQSTEHRAKLLKDIEKAAGAIRHFQERIVDPSIRAELNVQADKLDDFCSRAHAND